MNPACMAQVERNLHKQYLQVCTYVFRICVFQYLRFQRLQGRPCLQAQHDDIKTDFKLPGIIADRIFLNSVQLQPDVRRRVDNVF